MLHARRASTCRVGRQDGEWPWSRRKANSMQSDGVRFKEHALVSSWAEGFGPRQHKCGAAARAHAPAPEQTLDGGIVG